MRGKTGVAAAGRAQRVHWGGCQEPTQPVFLGRLQRTPERGVGAVSQILGATPGFVGPLSFVTNTSFGGL